MHWKDQLKRKESHPYSKMQEKVKAHNGISWYQLLDKTLSAVRVIF